MSPKKSEPKTIGVVTKVDHVAKAITISPPPSPSSPSTPRPESPGEVVTIATYDAAGKCADCGGKPGEHVFECPAVERGMKVGVPIGRLLPGGGSIDLDRAPRNSPEAFEREAERERLKNAPLIDTSEKLGAMITSGKLPATCTVCGSVVASGATCIVDGMVAP